MKHRLREGLRSLLQLDEPPQRTALAFGLGVWIGFSPFLGLHTWMAMATAVIFRLSRLALLVGAWINAWTAVPALVLGTSLGCWILGVSSDGLGNIHWNGGGFAFLKTLFHELRPFWWPFLLGNTLLGVLPAVVAYFSLLAALDRRRARRPISP